MTNETEKQIADNKAKEAREKAAADASKKA